MTLETILLLNGLFSDTKDDIYIAGAKNILISSRR
jgi:hypothetical protein